jgi:hypothetical protein
MIDLVRQTAADAIVLKQQQSGGTFLMRTTPVELLGEERARRAHAAAEHVRDGETLDDVDAVALRIAPVLVRLASEKK